MVMDFEGKLLKTVAYSNSESSEIESDEEERTNLYLMVKGDLEEEEDENS